MAKGIRRTPPLSRPMHCLVTGADGFIGSHLVEALLDWDGCDHVTALVHHEPVRWLTDIRHLYKLTILQGNVQRTSSLAHLPDADMVFHLAAISSASRCENAPEAARLTNFQGTINMLDRAMEMRPLPVFVFTSTAALYGEPHYLPVDEMHPVEPNSSYTYAKMGSEMTIQAYHRDQGLPMVIVRPFNIYGPRQSTDFVIPTIVDQVLASIQLRLGDGRPVRNFTFVTDAAQFLIRAAMAPAVRGKVINMGSRETTSIDGIVKMVLYKTGSALEPIYDIGKFREGDPTVLEMDPTMAETLLKWWPKVPMDTGLHWTIEHMRGELEKRQTQAAEDLYGSY